MASSTAGATAPRYTDTPFDRIFDPSHPESKKTHTLVMEYIKKKDRYDWAKRDLAPIIGCTLGGAAIGAGIGAGIGAITAGPPGAAAGAATGAVSGAIAGAAVGLFAGSVTAGYLNYRAYTDWASKVDNGSVAEAHELMTGCLPSEYICSIKQAPMMCPMTHKTIPGLRYDKDQIEELFKRPDINRRAEDTRPANTRIDPNTRQVISLEDFEIDEFAILSIKTILSNSMKTDSKIANARPVVKEGIQKFIDAANLDKKTHYKNSVAEFDRLLDEDKIDMDQHAQMIADLRKKLSML